MTARPLLWAETPAGRTDTGLVRASNQDNLLALVFPKPGRDNASDLLCLAVADGMGGHYGGEVASATAIYAVQEALFAIGPETVIGEEAAALADSLMRAAHNHVLAAKEADPNLSEMGTTLTIALAYGDELTIGHIGDSRAYLLRGGQATALTTDHTFVAEQVRAGTMTEEEALVSERRSMLTRAAGSAGKAEWDLNQTRLHVGDTLLVCTDGLYRNVTCEEMASLAASEQDSNKLCEALIDCGRKRGGDDNLTVVVARFGPTVTSATPGLALGADQRSTVFLRAGLCVTVSLLLFVAWLAVKQFTWSGAPRGGVAAQGGRAAHPSLSPSTKAVHSSDPTRSRKSNDIGTENNRDRQKQAERKSNGRDTGLSDRR